jgi:hypothetical protein
MWCSECKILIVLLGAFFINVEISINQLTSTFQKIGIQPIIKWYQISGCPWGIIMCLLVSFCLSTMLHHKSQKNYTLSVTPQGLNPCNLLLFMDVIKVLNQFDTNSIKFTLNSKIRSKFDFSFEFCWHFVEVSNTKVVSNIPIYL